MYRVFNKLSEYIYFYISKILLHMLFLRRCFPVNFAKFLKTLFFTENLGWLLLNTNLKLNNKFDIHDNNNSWHFLNWNNRGIYLFFGKLLSISGCCSQTFCKVAVLNIMSESRKKKSVTEPVFTTKNFIIINAFLRDFSDYLGMPFSKTPLDSLLRFAAYIFQA